MTTVATFNTLHGTAEIHPLADVIGFQEVDTAEGRAKVRALDGYAVYFPKGPALSAIPIAWRTDVWELVDAGDTVIVDDDGDPIGRKNVTPYRGFAWVRLRHLATGVVHTFVNTHMVSGAWSAPRPDTEWRRAFWRRHLRVLVAFLTGLRGPVTVLGDFNRDEWVDLPAGFHHAATGGARAPYDQIHSTLPLSPAKRGRKYGSDHYSWTATIPTKETPMSTGIYLEDNKPARSQFRVGRRAKPTGLFVIHTAEGVMDTVGPDTGAEGVARFIRDRDTPGSYHRLVDSDSIVPLVRLSNEAYGDGTGSNPYAIHVSFACKTSDWAKMTPAKRAAFLRNGAKAVVEGMTWLKREHGITSVPLKRVTKAQSSAGAAGFIPHGDRDPGRRSDPGADFPWAEFFAAIRDLLDPGPKTIHITAFRTAKTRAEKRAAAKLILERGSAKAKVAARDWLEHDTARDKAAKALLALEVK